MGKVRLKVVGDETAEKEQKEEQKKKSKAKSANRRKAKGLNMGGGQRINTVGVSEEEIAAEVAKGPTEPEVESPELKEKKGKKRKTVARERSERYKESLNLVAKKTNYPIPQGLELLRKFKKGRFDETVELHINVKEQGVSGQMSLPHGTGKKLRIKIADDALIAQVEQGKIDFDILVATPDMMPKLAKVAKVLGPRGLMPNPKNGTISDKPETVVEKLSAGQVNFRTEAQATIVHLSIGKLSFDDKKLKENIEAALEAIGQTKIENVTLKSTMSPGIRIQT